MLVQNENLPKSGFSLQQQLKSRKQGNIAEFMFFCCFLVLSNLLCDDGKCMSLSAKSHLSSRKII